MNLSYIELFTSHIYENQLELLHNYYIGPIDTPQIAQEVNEINTVTKPDEKDKTKCSNTNHIYQNIQKQQPREKIWTIPFLLEIPRNKEFQPPDLEIDFLIDSGAESNIINIPTWNEIKTLHPKLTLLATSSKLATAQGSTFVNYGKIQLFLLTTRTMEQNKILNKPFKQIFHITDIKHNIIGIPFISKYITTINILNSKILIKDKYTKTKNTALKFFLRLNKQSPIFSKFYPIYNQQPKHLKPLSGNIYNFSIKQVHQYDKSQNKQHQRVLCNEIRRLPNETIKQLAVRIETLVRKAYSLKTHDYKNTKMTENLMMTLTPQLRKIAIKKRASHPSSIREPDLDFRKLVDKLEQAEITMKLEETENLKLQYVNRIETNTTHINNIQESDTDLIEKITEILNIYEN